MFTVPTFQAELDDLVSRYLKLPSHPKMFMSLPLPIPFGQEMPGPPYKVATKDVLPAFEAVAAKYNIPLIDLYHPFLGHKELFIEEGEHIVNPAGLNIEAEETYKVLMAVLNGGAGALDGGGTPPSSADASVGAAPADASVAVVDAGPAPATGGSGGGGGSGAGGGPAGTGGESGGGATPTTGSGGSGAGGAPRRSGGGCSFEGANGGAGSLALGALVLGLALTRSRRRR
jgi:MYXO-CTERM domain-containing protein